MWIPRNKPLFGWVSIFCFHHSYLTKLSYDLVNLETKNCCFWAIKIELRWQFGNFSHILGPRVKALSHHTLYLYSHTNIIIFRLRPFNSFSFSPFLYLFLYFMGRAGFWNLDRIVWFDLVHREPSLEMVLLTPKLAIHQKYSEPFEPQLNCSGWRTMVGSHGLGRNWKK